MSETLALESSAIQVLEPYLPSPSQATSSRPFVTLTFATSLDSQLSLAPGVRTRLSGPDSKAMTHYLRSQHSAILVGISTLLADNPGLNCRIAGAFSQPRPIIVDPHLRWSPAHTDKVLQISKAGQGLAPYVLTGVLPDQIPSDSLNVLNSYGGKFIHIEAHISEADARLRFDWHGILEALRKEGLTSVMVEGGGQIINSLLSPNSQPLIDSVIVTIAPTWLGQGGVVVSPERVQDQQGVPVPVSRLSAVKWHPFGEDVVLCGKLQS